MSIIDIESVKILGKGYREAKELIENGNKEFRELLEGANRLAKAIFIDTANAIGDKELAALLLSPYISDEERVRIEAEKKAEEEKLAAEEKSKKEAMRAEILAELELEKSEVKAIPLKTVPKVANAK